MLIKTPPILLNWDFQEYFDEFNAYYKGIKIVYPESNEDVTINIWNQTEVLHYICWKDNTDINSRRAEKLLWIRFLIEEKELRDVFEEKENGNILFVSRELCYIVVISKATKPASSFFPKRRVVTMYVKNKADLEKMYGDKRYTVLYKR